MRTDLTVYARLATSRCTTARLPAASTSKYTALVSIIVVLSTTWQRIMVVGVGGAREPVVGNLPDPDVNLSGRGRSRVGRGWIAGWVAGGSRGGRGLVVGWSWVSRERRVWVVGWSRAEKVAGTSWVCRVRVPGRSRWVAT